MRAETVTTLARSQEAPRQAWFKRQAKLAPYLFTAPFFILFFVFFLFPSLAALVLSLFKWNGIGAPRWLGFRNFTQLFTDPDFWQAAGNTVIYMLASLFIVIPLAALLAALLNARSLGLKDLWRSSYFTPIVTSTVAIALVFSLLYSKDYGLINAALVSVGLPRINWLGDGTWAKVSIIVLIMWRWTGYTMIYLLAGMQSISLSVLVVIGSLQIFEEPYILTSGGPANATMSISQYLYIHGIRNLRFGLGSAVGLLLFVVIFSLSALQLRVFGVFRED
jgi:multiple sugar transport system permease protein